MLIRRSQDNRNRKDETLTLAEIDLNIQCVAFLWDCETIKERGPDEAKKYWMKMAERAWCDFDDDRQFLQRGREGSNGTLDL